MSPMRATWLHPRWLFSRRAAKALLWTVVLVAAAVGWIWMRRRLLAREDQNGADRQARRRLVRSEIAGVVAIMVLEASLLMQG